MRLVLMILLFVVYPFMAFSCPQEALTSSSLKPNTEVDSVTNALKYFTAYKTLDKRKELALYVATLKKAHSWTPSDSITMKYKALYTIGNAFIFSALYDSAAYYLNKAYDYDREYDLGKYEGAVADRLSVIFYNLEDYPRSLKFAEYALKYAQPRLRAAVYYQIANTHTQNADYALAAEAYDSAQATFERLDSPNWWYPLFYSIPALIELNDTAGFSRAYKSLAEVPIINRTPELLNLTKWAEAEFTLTEWERGSESVFLMNKFVLLRTEENEIRLRERVVDRIQETKEQWEPHRNAQYMLLRYYRLVHPDSVKVVYDQILALDQAYIKTRSTNNAGIPLENSSTKALQNLVARMGFDMLASTLTETDYIKSTLRKQSRNLVIQALLLLLALIAMRRALRIRRARLNTIIQLERLQEVEAKLLKELTPDTLVATSGKTAQEITYPDLIVLTSRFSHFGRLVSETSPDKVFSMLTDYLGSFKEEIQQYGLEEFRIDGDNFIAVGGHHRGDASPISALKAAQRMHVIVERLNKKYNLKISLRIGIHLGVATGEVYKNAPAVMDLWGEA
ncbi:MAG: adenylate/guanylate cyclase domain-containing protein, partial [Schleiferiaceae bacterium]|nr:adenylate/guanylate cyclase domain-containing protein [Schleiferiaceae bacterium]